MGCLGTVMQMHGCKTVSMLRRVFGTGCLAGVCMNYDNPSEISFGIERLYVS